MHIREITLAQFMRHEETTTVELPERGLVVVTGPNGAGKSSMIEGVATAIWGKTLRGTTPWRAGEAGYAEVLTDAIRARRTCTKGGAKKLKWFEDAEEAWRTYDTSTKAQMEMTELVGEFDRWRSTHVFSSQDAAHFTMASDGERKRLLENLLGLDRFDAAYKACRGDLKASERGMAEAKADRQYTAASFQGCEGELQRFDEYDAAEQAPEEPEAWDENMSVAIAHKIQASQAELYELQRARELAIMNLSVSSGRVPEPYQQSPAAVELTAARKRFDLAKHQATQLAHGICPTCEQDIPPDRWVRRFEALEEAEAEVAAKSEAVALEDAQARAAAKAVDEAIWAAQELEKGFRAEAHDIESRRHAWERWRSTHTMWAKRDAQRSTARTQLVQRLSAAESHLGDAEDAVFDWDKRTRELEAVATVLGLRGVRATVLGQALGGIEAVANAWLGRIAGAGLTLSLKPYTEQTNGVADKISLDVLGAGGGYGYKASSGGERRRIDTSLLLALAEVSAAAAGLKPGTIFLDEVFDALDTEGVSAACEALADLAFDRAVVVITHSEELARRLPAVMRLHVTKERGIEAA